MACWLLLACPAADPPQQGETKPNIVLILADDMAWYDYGFMGHPIARTPHLDQLASESVVFERGYVPTGICRPSLMTLLTGLYPHQHHITGNDPAGGFRQARYPREALLANIDSLPALPRILTANGYLTFQSGKWWEGHYSRGGFTHGMTQGRRHGDDGLSIGREGMQPIFDFVELALAEQKPFFVWYAPFMPHTPHTPPARLLETYTQQGLSPHQAKYYAMIEWFDETCGELLDFLQANSLRENTLVYYLCDNGWIQRPDQNGFDLGSKQTPMEAGVRTPILFSWPGNLQPARRQEYISSIDLLPTVLHAAGISPPPGLPGLDLWEALTTGQPIERERIFGEGYGHNIMDKDDPEASLAYLWCIEAPWKLILCYDGAIEGYRTDAHEDMRTQPIRLYNIEKDPYEQHNLAEQYPALIERLSAEIARWYPLQQRKLWQP